MKERGYSSDFVREAFLNRTAEPKKPIVLFDLLAEQGISQEDSRSVMWHMLDQGDLALTYNMRVQAQEPHLRQLDFLEEIGEER